MTKLMEFCCILVIGLRAQGSEALSERGSESRATAAPRQSDIATVTVPDSIKRQQARLDRLMPPGQSGRTQAIIILVGHLSSKPLEDQASSRRPQDDRVREFDGWVKHGIKRQFGSITLEQTQLISLYVVGKLIASAPRGSALEQQRLEIMLQELNQLTRRASALLSKDDNTLRSILAKIR